MTKTIILTEFEFGNDYIDNCDYLDTEEFREVQISPKDLSIVQLNIRGLIGKQEKLLKFLNSSNKEKIDIVILSETWLTKSSEK